MTQKKYDLLVLGGGIAGYSAAIRARQLGKTVAIVEAHKIGGTCLHRGCIPTKSFLKSAEVYHTIKNAGEFGFSVDNVQINLKDVIARKNNIVDTMFKGLSTLIKHSKIDVYHGVGRLMGSSIFSPQNGTVSVELENDESVLLTNDYVLITTGSKPASLPFLSFNHSRILDSTDLLAMETLPDSIAIIGGGVIGVEFATYLNEFGVNVSIFEASKRLLIQEDAKVSETIEKALSQKGINIYTNVQLNEENTITNDDAITIKLDNETHTFNYALLAIGRTPNVDNIGLNNTKVQLSSRNFIETDSYMCTAETHIYAAGDVVGGLQLAHVGAKEGIIAVEHMFNQDPLTIDYKQMPRCIYTYPEIASIGLSETEAKSQNINYKQITSTFKANGKALIESRSDETMFAKLLFDRDTDTFIGGTLIGPHATEMINELSVLHFMDGSAMELGTTTHAHPSTSELMMEIGLKHHNQSIHI